ncbi:MAG TPA: hypothetical protein VMV10_09465 [Pirellulales bacterium]|nr:hypothetical protein [Pirellulales bacterium]
MRLVAGAILVLTAESAYAHAHLIGFPYQPAAREVLLPASIISMIVGAGFVVWGAISERK